MERQGQQQWFPDFPSQPGYPAPSPKRRRTGMIAGITVGVLVVIAGLVAGLLVFLNSKDDSAASSWPVSESSTSRTPPAPGWKTLELGLGVFVEVPPAWQPVDGTFIPDVRTRGARYKPGYCAANPKAILGQLYLDRARTTDPMAAAADALMYRGTRAFRSGGQVSSGPVGRRPDGGAQVQGTVTPYGRGECDPPSTTYRVVALPTAQGTLLVVVWGDLQMPDSPAEEDLTRIADSARLG
ncbi:hypothetical protein [Amycolatopsis japonica]